MKRVSILGATGSVGQSTLDLIRRAPEAYHIEALTAHSNVADLANAARQTRARLAVIGRDDLLHALRDALKGSDVEAASGANALTEAAARPVDWTMAAIVGCAGLPPVMTAARRGGVIALANKEALVSAGPLLISAVSDHGARLLPVDSEHNAIFQCLDRSAPQGIHKLILTASGGPFRSFTLDEMAAVTPEQAVRHPNWDMGRKISIDSATMFNKGLELIEARYLFDIPDDRIDVLVHPQSVVHSMVEYIDGSVLAQLGPADMRVPIAHCLAWPERMTGPAERLDLARIGQLDFEPVDPVRFPALALARHALRHGGSAPAIFNAANEVAVAAFLERRIGFLSIAQVVERTLERYQAAIPATLDDVITVDQGARREAEVAIVRHAR